MKCSAAICSVFKRLLFGNQKGQGPTEDRQEGSKDAGASVIGAESHHPNLANRRHHTSPRGLRDTQVAEEICKSSALLEEPFVLLVLNLLSGGTLSSWRLQEADQLVLEEAVLALFSVPNISPGIKDKLELMSIVFSFLSRLLGTGSQTYMPQNSKLTFLSDF